MKKLTSAVLYTALALGAIAAPQGPAEAADIAELEALRAGDMAKLTFHAEPREASDAVLTDADGEEVRLDDYAGKYILVNFWATWCAPCRAEMPSLDRLQAEFGGEAFEVVPVATGRNPLPAIDKFFADVGIEALPVVRDPKQELARDMSVLGLPISVILNPEGQEIARLRGDAEWDSESARAIFEALTAEP